MNNLDVPDNSWNRLEQYYPGDEWIDWVGVSVYSAQTSTDPEWLEFRGLMDQVYPRLTALAPSKPIILAEFGVTAGNPLGNQATWADRALADLTVLCWSRLIGFAWWNEAWQNDNNPAHDTTMRLQDNAELARVFQRWVGQNDRVLGRAVLK